MQKSARVVAQGGRHLNKQIEKYLISKLGEKPKNKFVAENKEHTASFMEFHQNLLLGDIKEALSVRRTEESSVEALLPFVDYELPDHQMITI